MDTLTRSRTSHAFIVCVTVVTHAHLSIQMQWKSTDIQENRDVSDLKCFPFCQNMHTS